MVGGMLTFIVSLTTTNYWHNPDLKILSRWKMKKVEAVLKKQSSAVKDKHDQLYFSDLSTFIR